MKSPGRVVLDAEVLRFSLTHDEFRRQITSEFPIWSLSSVVAQELRRAARREAKAAVDRLIARVPKRVEPGWTDWMVAAEYLAHLGEAAGFDPDTVPRHQNDCLIAASAWRQGLPLVTCNADDFRRIATFMKARAGHLIALASPR